MDWFYTKRRGLTQGSSVSAAPPLQLVAIFCIVVVLLSFSQYNNYKEQVHYMKFNFQLFIFLVPVLLIFFMRSSLVSGKFNVWAVRSRPAGGGGFPWGVAVMVLVLLVLVSYQSSFQSKWFAPLGRSD